MKSEFRQRLSIALLVHNSEFRRHKKTKLESRKSKFFSITSCFLLLASCLLSFTPVRAGLSNTPVKRQITRLNPPLPIFTAMSRNCQNEDLETLINQLLTDLPGYANRASQRARRLSRKSDFYTYVLVAGHPEFAPLTLGPGVYAPKQTTNSQVKQVFFTTLERQYTGGQAIELQQFHWVFLTKTGSGWRLATIFSQIGGYPAKKPPTPPRESSDGVIAQAINLWLRDCQARTTRG